MSNKSRRIKALEKRIAALEAKNQAQQAIEAGPNAEELAEAVIKSINQLTAEKGKAVLLL